VEYTYDSTAPALTDQNTPLGTAGPKLDHQVLHLRTERAHRLD
jgi:hypothetical protein